jgi:hypothetical protein
MFGIKEFIHHTSVLVEYEYFSSKNRGLQMGPKKRNNYFIQNVSKNIDYISVGNRDHLLK